MPAGIDRGVAQWAFDHAEAAGYGTDTLPGSPVLYLPLKAPMRLRGVLAIEPKNPARLVGPVGPIGPIGMYRSLQGEC